MVEKDWLAEEQDGRPNTEENLEGSLDEPNIPHMTHSGRGHRRKVQEECLEPPQGKNADVESVVIEVVGEDRKLDLNESLKDLAACLEATELWPIEVLQAVGRKHGVHNTVYCLLDDEGRLVNVECTDNSSLNRHSRSSRGWRTRR